MFPGTRAIIEARELASAGYSRHTRTPAAVGSQHNALRVRLSQRLPARSPHRQQAEIASRNPASSRRTATAEHALRYDHVAHNLLGKLIVVEGEHNLPVRPSGLAIIGLVVPATSDGMQERRTKEIRRSESGH
jgi:hypothetical protein